MKIGTRRTTALASLIIVCAAAAWAVMPAVRAAPGPYHALGVYGYPGGDIHQRVKLVDGVSIEYSELLGFAFSGPIDPKSATVSIEPAAPYKIRAFGYGATLQIRKVPGVTYTVTVGASSATGESAAPSVFHFSTPPITAYPAPVARVDGPYRYGTLGHDYPDSLGGPNRDRLIALDVEAGVRFVRIDIAGKDVEPLKGTFTWGPTDAILQHLLAAGITELPVLPEYEVGTWATNGKPHPAIWVNPQDYADFAGAVAEHLKAFPRVSRIELFNEPNLHHWGEFPTDASATQFDDSGRRAAVYMQAAYAAIKAHNPALRVVGPALASGGTQTPPLEFLENMYAAGCRTGTCWDVLSIHAYDVADPTSARPVDRQDGRVDNYKDIQAVALEHGDPRPHVMLDEHGYSNAMRADSFDPQVQALYEAKLFNLVLADPTVDGVVWVNIDIGYRPGPTDFFGRTSLVDNDGRKLPGFEVFREFAKQ